MPEVFTTATARSLGVSRSALRGPSFVRLAHGTYVRLDDAVDEPERLALLATALPADCTFSHQTAGALLGAPIPAPPRPHVSLTPRKVLPQHAGLVVHRRRLLGQDVVEHRGLRVTAGPQTFLDLAAVLPAHELVAAGDALTRTGQLDDARLTERLVRADRVRGVVRARACAPLLDPRAQSRPESLARYWLGASDLPDPELQVPVHDRHGREVAHGDLGYSRYRVLLEYEGRQHAEPEQFDRDIDRYSLMAAGGWLVLRFARRHLAGPRTIVERTRGALLSRGWRPGQC